MSGQLYLVTGIGHCGTAWAAEVFRRHGIRSFHEAKKEWSSETWVSLTEKELDEKCVASFYIKHMREELEEHPIVVDSHSFVPTVLPWVVEELEVAGIIILVRNGIQNVNSLYHHNLTRSNPAFEKFVNHAREAVGLTDNREGVFEMWCAWWACNALFPLYLAQRLPNVKGATALLEGLTTDTFELKQMLWWVDPKLDPDDVILRELQATDINRKIEGDRSPEVLWQSWTPFQQEAFVRICGETMEHFDYRIPK